MGRREAQQEIVDLFRKNESGMAPKDITQALHRKGANIRFLLMKMLENEDVARSRSVRALIPHGAASQLCMKEKKREPRFANR